MKQRDLAVKLVMEHRYIGNMPNEYYELHIQIVLDAKRPKIIGYMDCNIIDITTLKEMCGDYISEELDTHHAEWGHLGQWLSKKPKLPKWNGRAFHIEKIEIDKKYKGNQIALWAIHDATMLLGGYNTLIFITPGCIHEPNFDNNLDRCIGVGNGTVEGLKEYYKILGFKDVSTKNHDLMALLLKPEHSENLTEIQYEE